MDKLLGALSATRLSCALYLVDHDEFAMADLAATMNVSASLCSSNIELPPPPPSSQIQPSLTRRPTHRARHSVDVPVLAPRDPLLLPRDSSPAVSGEYVPSPSSLNAHSPSMSGSFERTSSNGCPDPHGCECGLTTLQTAHHVLT
ncbi:hypothetical protein BGW80DRAFT_1567051 [Lactifluus volemus]|nr:hypothetical protein BGW80DRAFT_1567051 [Lactifluus volemus]